MKASGRSEERFFIAFEDLIKKFTDDRSIPTDENKGFSKDFIKGFEDMSIPNLSSNESSSTVDDSELNFTRLDLQFDQFMSTLEETSFTHHIIPYDRITKSVFENTPEEDLDEFTEDLYKRGTEHFSKKDTVGSNTTDEKIDTGEDSNFEKMYFKILRHINLALVQKYTLMKIQIKEVEALKRDQQRLINQYDALKKDAESQSRNMLTQFITILGIFAAILMGAFGAIQGFANLFDNAHKLELGVLLIISSIGASSVLLILFFLLNGIAKLTDRSLSSTNKVDATTFEKHPTLVIVHGVLIFIALVGVALILSNTKIYFALEGIWWILPIFWFTFLIIATHKKNFIFPITMLIDYKRRKNK